MIKGRLAQTVWPGCYRAHGPEGGRILTVVDWLLDSDPSIRWQVMRDLTDAPADEVAAERARVATEGAGARLLALQAADGRWGGAAWNRGVGLHDARPDAAAGNGSRSRERRGTARRGPRPRPRHVAGMRPAGMRRQSLLHGRGRAVHQRPGGGERRLLRPGRPGPRLSAARRAASRRRLELRGRKRLDAVVVQHHDLRARGPARTRTGRREQSGRDRGPAPRAGVPPRAPPLPPAVDRRGDRARSQGRGRVEPLRLPDLVALRR